MKPRLWHYIDAMTGVGNGRSVYDTQERADANAPSGMLAWPVDEFDWLCQRIDIRTGDVVDYQPPAPPETDLLTWLWDESISRWMPAPTLLALGAQARVERDRRMDATVSVTLKAFRTGQPIPADWAAYMQALADVPQQAGFPESITWPIPPSA